jgi:hypothetical protein
VSEVPFFPHDSLLYGPDHTCLVTIEFEFGRMNLMNGYGIADRCHNRFERRVSSDDRRRLRIAVGQIKHQILGEEGGELSPALGVHQSAVPGFGLHQFEAGL